MAIDLLTTSQINTLVQSFQDSENQKSITPLNTRKTKYQNLVSSYGNLSSKITSLKSILDTLKTTGTDSIFKTKSISLTDSTYFTATAASTAANGNYDLKVNQIAKNDTVFSTSLTSAGTSVVSGTHEMLIKTGDGSGGEFTSHISVDFNGTETNQTVMEKIRDAIQSDKAVVVSNSKNGSDLYSGGASTFKLTLSGTEHTINITDATDYNDLMDKIIVEVNKISGINAEKTTDNGNVQLKLTVLNNTDDLSISHVSGNNLIDDLNIGANKEKSSAAMISASIFKPDSSKSRLSFAAKNTGLDYSIKEISDINGGTALNQVALNFGTSRNQYDQQNSPDSSGFLYADTSITQNLLNSKVELNGISIQRNSNQISDLIDGITLNLKTAMKSDASAINFSCNTDITSIKTKVDSFITKFNDLYTYTKSNSGVTSVLRGDSNLTTITNMLSGMAFGNIAGISPTKLNSLSKIGISFNPTSGLSISDTDLFTKKVTENLSEVEDIFNSEHGIANDLGVKMQTYLGSGGTLNRSITSFNNNITWLSDRITSTQTRIDKSAESLRSRYEQLQAQMASLTTTQSYFG